MLALIAWLAAPATWAMGLGDIELDSALNEKLDAEIELHNAEGLQPTEVIVSLASTEDFERVGVERFFFLTDLRFEVDYDNGGVSSIKVTSIKPVTEPYLNFLVEVLWPSGRLLKEYTLLLDPPTFSPAPAPTVSAPAQSRDGDAGAGRVERQTSSSASRGTQVQLAPGRQQQPSPLDDGVVDGEYRMTDRTDTLWTIAARTRPSQAVSVQQNMLAIQQLNPQAFINDNINLLKAGYSLRLPTEQQALSLSNAEAGQLVAMQNEDWRALQRGEPVPSRSEQRVAATDDQSEPELQARVDATAAPSGARAAAPQGDGELRIVAGAGDGTASGGSTEELNAALEEQDRLGLEVESLTQELDRERELASNQIVVKDRQLEVKDQQIAEMQAEIERLREEMQQVQAAAAGQSQNQSASGTETWWQSPYVLGAAVGAVVLLLVYALVVARRRRADEDFYPEVAAEDTRVMDRPEPVVAAAAMDQDFADDQTLDEQRVAVEPRRAETARAEAERAETAEETGSETNDVIGEADIYIAYGRYPQAIGLLLGVLEENPGRNDVRLKLLELYAETRDRDAFDAHMTELLARCDDDEALLTARELAAQFGDEVPATSGTGNPGETLDEDDLDLDELAAQDESHGGEFALSEVKDFDADDNFDEVDDLEFDDAAASAAITGAADAQAPLGSEDFELELDDLAEDDAGSAEDTSHHRAGDSLGGDLGIDFDPERQRNGEEHADAEPEDLTSGDDLDLDLDDAEALDDDAFDFEDAGDTAGTKLDLARAYIDMGDQDGARDILNEVVAEGNSEQQQRAQAMLEEL